MSPTDQVRVWLAMALCGAACAAARMMMSAAGRLTGAAGQAARSAGDLTAGVLLALMMTAAGLRMQTTVWRMHAFAGAAAGIALFYTAIVQPLRGIRRAILRRGSKKNAGKTKRKGRK